MTRIAITTTWTCVTGVAVLLTYSILTCHKNTKEAQQEAAAVAERIAAKGTIPEYKSPNGHFSAVQKKTLAKVVDPDVKKITYVPNPIYPPFTNALAKLQGEYMAALEQGDVALTNGFVLTQRDGKPFLVFPDPYKVAAGGFEIGSELKGGHYAVASRTVPGTVSQEVAGIALVRHQRLEEPEFYCTDVRVSALPSTGQIDALKMSGNLKVVNTDNAKAVVEEIAGYLTKDYAARELEGNVPAGTVAQKKFKIGEGMDVCVSVKWKDKTSKDGSDATVAIDFSLGELSGERDYQSKTLGEATDLARKQTLATTGVNYFTVSQKVNAEIGKDKIVR